MASQENLTSGNERINRSENLVEENELRFENALIRSEIETFTFFIKLLDFCGRLLRTRRTAPSYSLNVVLVLALTVNELVSLATLESPMWSWSQGTLNLNEYYSRFFPWYAKNVPRFVHEASKASGYLSIDASSLVRKLMDPVHWMEIFTSLVGDVSLESSFENIQVIEMEFMTLMSPLIPTRKVKVLRCCNRIETDTWVVADISMYFSSYSQDLRPEFMRFPSGYIIQHISNGFSKVTILEHWVYKEEAIINRFRSYLSSGFGFGAHRWLIALKRYISSTLSIPMPAIGQQIQIINSTGRANLLNLSRCMVNIFCTGMCGIIGQTWRRLDTGRLLSDNIRIFTREWQDMRRNPRFIISASGLVRIQAKPDVVFPLLYGEKKRPIWNYLWSSGDVLEEVIRITRQSTPRNDVSVFTFPRRGSKEVFLMQETYYEPSSSMIIQTLVDKQSLFAVINGGDSCNVGFPSGLAIMPGQNSGDDEGCVVSAGCQIITTQAMMANTEALVDFVKKTLSDTFENVKSLLSANMELH